MAFEFPMFSVAPFITPFATKYDPNEAAKAMAANFGQQNAHEDRQAELKEQTREYDTTKPRLDFEAYGRQYTANRGQTEVETEHDTALMKWIHDVVRDDPEKAEAAAPFLHGILQSRGISMDWDPQTGEMQGPDQLPGATHGVAQGQPGESFPSFYDRMVKAAPAGIPIPGTSEEDMIQRHLDDVGAPRPPPGQSEGERSIAEIQRIENEGKSIDPGFEMPDPWGGRNLDPGSAMPDPYGGRNIDPGIEMQTPPRGQMDTNGPAPGENLQQYFGRELAPQVPKKAPPQAAAPAAPPKRNAPVAQAAPAAEAPAEAPTEPPKRGRWVFSKNGKEMGSIDMAGLREIDQRQSAAVGKGFNTGVLPAEDRAFVAAQERVIKESGMNREDAQKYLKNVVQPELDRRSRERGSIANAKAKASSGPSISGVSTVHDDIQNIQEHFATRYGVNDLHKRALAAQSAEELVKSDNPMEQRDALTQHLKSMFSSVTSDRELGFASEAAGKLTQIEMKFNSWFSGGELPENYRSLLAEANSIIQEQTKRELGRVGEAAHGYIMRDPTLSLDKKGRTQAAGVVKGYFTGTYDVPEVEGPSGIPGMRGGAGGMKTSESSRHGNLSDEQKKLMGK